MASSAELTHLRRHLGGRGTGSWLKAKTAGYWCAEDWGLVREDGDEVPGPRESLGRATQLLHGGPGSCGWTRGDDTAWTSGSGGLRSVTVVAGTWREHEKAQGGAEQVQHGVVAGVASLVETST